MKTLLYTLLLLSTLGCEFPIVFDQPYPIGSEDLDAFPQHFIGEYYCEYDCSRVVITNDAIVKNYQLEFRTPLSEVQESYHCTIVEDHMYLEGQQACIPLTYINDTVVSGIINVSDTIFIISNNRNLRLHNDNVVINTKTKDGDWVVALLQSLEGRDVVLRSITPSTHIKSVEQITSLEPITTESDVNPQYRINPTLVEFDQLINNRQVYIDCEYLIKVPDRMDDIFQ